MTRSAIHARGLRKSYGDHVVLDGVGHFSYLWAKRLFNRDPTPV